MPKRSAIGARPRAAGEVPDTALLVASLAILVLTAFAAFAARPAAADGARHERGLRRIRYIPPAEYGARGQNRAMAESSQGVLYFGNLEGLLEYDGARWNRAPLPNDSAIFSLAVARDGRIAAAGIDEFGLFSHDPTGRLVYTSLSKLLPEAARAFDAVRAIHTTADGLAFRSHAHLFLWNGREIRAVPAPAPAGSLLSSWDVDGTIVVSTTSGLAVLVGDRVEPLPGERFAGRVVDAVVSLGGGRRLAVVRDAGLFLLDASGEAVRVAPEVSSWLAGKRVTKALRLGDGRLLLTTRQNGALVLSADFETEERLTGANGPPLDEILSAGVDSTGDVWLGLDMGLARVELSSPTTLFDRRLGLGGSPQEIVRHRGRLYAATSAGIYVLREAPGGAAFRHVSGVEGVVLAFAAAGGDLLAGDDRGLHAVEADGSRLLPGTEGLDIQTLAPSPSDPARFWVGLRDGLGVLRKEGGAWRFKRLAPDVKTRIRSIEETAPDTIWLGSIFEGVFRVTIPGDGRDAAIQRFTPRGERQVGAVRGRLLVLGVGGVERPDEATGRLVPERAFGDIRTTLFRVAEDASGNVWFNTQPPSVAFRESDGRYRLDTRALTGLPGQDVQMVVAEPDGVVWLGSEEGLVRYDTRLSRRTVPPAPPLLRRVATASGDLALAPSDAAGPALPYAFRRLRFEFAATPRTNGPHYQVRLDGADGDWSPFSPEAFREYTNLWEGDYTFRVRVRDAYGTVGPEATYRFRVEPPWWRRWWAFALAAALFLGLGVVILRVRHRALLRRNLALEAKVAERTRELAQAADALARAKAEVEETNVRLSEANQQLTSLSYRDGLTGVANRRFFEETLLEEWNRSFRAGTPLALVLLDLDLFKELNDSRGHHEGDECLKAVATALDEAVRRSGELVARYGGEEFAVLLPGTALASAAALAEALRARVEALGWPHPSTASGVVTASFGVSALTPREGGTKDVLLATADSALYRAKEAGRNRVEVA